MKDHPRIEVMLLGFALALSCGGKGDGVGDARGSGGGNPSDKTGGAAGMADENSGDAGSLGGNSGNAGVSEAAGTAGVEAGSGCGVCPDSAPICDEEANGGLGACIQSPFTGNWVGTTGDGRDFGFTVRADGTLDSLIVYVRLNLGGSTCTGPASATGPVAVNSEGSFSTIVAFPDSSVTVQLEGRFAEDGAHATGTYDGYSGDFFAVCGSSFTTGSGSPLSDGTWEATRGVLPCRFAADGRCDEPLDGAYACLTGTDSADCGEAPLGTGGAGGSGGIGGAAGTDGSGGASGSGAIEPDPTLGGAGGSGGIGGAAGTDGNGGTSGSGSIEPDPTLGGYHESDTWHGFVEIVPVDGTTVNPSSFDELLADGPYCVSGVVPGTESYGAAILLSFAVNQLRVTDAVAQPLTPTGTGVRINVSNALETDDIRVQLTGPGGGPDDRWCAAVPAFGEEVLVPWSAFSTECWLGGQGDPYQSATGGLRPIRYVNVYVPDGGPDAGDTQFDFCVHEVGPG